MSEKLIRKLDSEYQFRIREVWGFFYIVQKLWYLSYTYAVADSYDKAEEILNIVIKNYG